MQKKRKREKADEGPSHAPAIALKNGHLDEESHTELKDVSGMTSVFK